MKYTHLLDRPGISFAPFFETEPYQELVTAVRADDTHRMGEIIRNQLGSTTGAERFFWLNLQLASRLRYTSTPCEVYGHWGAVMDLARAAGKDPFLQQKAVEKGFAVLVTCERLGELARFCLSLRDGFFLHRRAEWSYWYNRGLLYVLQSRCREGFDAFSKALDLFRRLPPAQFAATSGWLCSIYAQRATCAVANGLPEAAENDLTDAMLNLKDQSRRPWLVLVGDAELNLLRGAFSSARKALQLARLESQAEGTERSPHKQITVELIAARIARAEGNMLGLRHFANRALAIAQQHDLPLSQARVWRIMNGAEH